MEAAMTMTKSKVIKLFRVYEAFVAQSTDPTAKFVSLFAVFSLYFLFVMRLCVLVCGIFSPVSQFINLSCVDMCHWLCAQTLRLMQRRCCKSKVALYYMTQASSCPSGTNDPFMRCRYA
jgi:hypothetical protein